MPGLPPWTPTISIPPIVGSSDHVATPHWPRSTASSPPTPATAPLSKICVSPSTPVVEAHILRGESEDLAVADLAVADLFDRGVAGQEEVIAAVTTLAAVLATTLRARIGLPQL